MLCRIEIRIVLILTNCPRPVPIITSNDQCKFMQRPKFKQKLAHDLTKPTRLLQVQRCVNLRKKFLIGLGPAPRFWSPLNKITYCRKYEEIYPPDVSEFCYITDDTYTKKQVLRMEHLILEVLGFECSPPTAHFFANHFAKLSGLSGSKLNLGQLFLALVNRLYNGCTHCRAYLPVRLIT